MKKIGIITYHFANNYGSALQCYALQEYLMSRNYDVRIINYVNNKQLMNNSFPTGLKGTIKNFLLFPLRKERIKKIEKFLNFREKYLIQTKHVSTVEELELLIKNEKFDYIISGSDQVFNPNINDYDDAFVFPFKTTAKKIGYAASLGDAKDNELKSILTYLEDFNKISLREEASKDFFEKIINKKVEVVCDPVFLVSQNQWKEKIKIFDTEYKFKDDFLLCYFIHKKYMNKSIRIARKIAKEKKLKIVFINAGYSIYSYLRNTLVGCGPCDFLSLFLNASYICTDSFHGTSFSIIFNKNFVCIDTINNSGDSRRLSLLKKMMLEDRLQYVENKVKDYSDLSYDKCNNIIADYSSISKKFLEFK